jgi:UDP-N-acetyl-D-mannosaminuronic acid dehydrogenase/UDP-N-acetyl-D-glucosamine dehydrogenase
MGQGYVGLPLAMRAVDVGYRVVGYDTDIHRVQRLAKGDSYIEDVPSSDVSRALDFGSYLPTSNSVDCAGFDVAVITVPTPLTDGIPDLSYIVSAGQTLAPHLRAGTCVVLESTTYPGTTSELLAPLLESSGLRAGIDFHVGYSPERIDPGNKTWTFVNTPKVVSGLTPASLAVVQRFYDTLVDRTVAVSGVKEAELTKLLENTFRHVNIALMNELAMFASDLGVDLWEAIDSASTKPYGFMRFEPGPGVGGHCLPVDPSYLSWKVKRALGSPFRFVELANDVNDHMPNYVAHRITVSLNRERRAMNGARILVLGLAYKRNSHDDREAPGPVLCALLDAFRADVRAVDPFLDDSDFPACVTRVDLSAEELERADLVVIVTDHDDLDWDMVARRSNRVFDTRHRLKPAPNVEYL